MSLQNFVIVDGYLVYMRLKCDNLEEENFWLLKFCQIYFGQVDIFVNYIKVGVEIVVGIEDVLFLFSGGEIIKDVGFCSEV